MSIIYGFLQVNKFDSGVVGVNPIGQLSPLSLTYGPTTSFSANTSNSELIIFNPATALTLETGITLTSIAVALSNVVDYATAQTSILADIQVALGNGFSNVSIGSLVLNPSENITYPSSITFTHTASNQVFKIWLADANFQAEYPDGTIRVVTPISNLLDLYNNFNSVKTSMGAVTSTTLFEKLNLLNLPLPATGYYTRTFRVFQLADNRNWFDFPVLFVFNGGALKCNPTTALDAFKNTLLNSGLITLQQWETVIPSLVPTDKFYVIPDWNNLSVSNGGNIGSPVLNFTNNLSSIIQSTYFPDYTNNQVSNYLNYTSVQFNSYGIYVLPDANNADGRLTFENKFTDYFLVPVNDSLVNKMSVDTQNMVTLLTELISMSIDPLIINHIPSGMNIETRNGHKYLVSTVGFITLAVLINGL